MVVNADAFLSAVRDDQNTELSRLGSSKSLYADTRGEMEPDAVLAAAAGSAGGAADALDRWSDDDDTGVFASARDSLEDHRAGLREHLDDRGTEPPAAVVGLGDREDRVERLGALVGWTLVSEQKASQCSGFFTGQADPGTADLFRGFGEDYERIREDALAALEAACETERDRERALGAATDVIERAYGAYVETLEELGVNPKPVC